MRFVNHYLFPILLVSFLTSCASIPDYRAIVDTSDIKEGETIKIFNEEEYANDYINCERVVNNVDYSDEKTKAMLKGAAGGLAVVGTGVATVLASGGVVMLPVVLPIYAIGALIGGGSNKNATREEEQKMRAIVWNSCLTEKGYKVFSDPNYTN
tara:strand:- start:64 stop:525 length:462 start_codon:yes stop_codon:yes gene_type:complete